MPAARKKFETERAAREAMMNAPIEDTESFASQAFDYWMANANHPWVIGDSVWTGWDYLGESSIRWIGFGYPVYWPGYENKKLTVQVYSSCDEVELFLNASSLGRRPTTRDQRFRAYFGVNYQPGLLKAVGYNNGKAVAEWTLQTVGNPTAIHLRPERTTLAADGASLAYLPFEVTEAAGRLHPDAAPLVHFKIEGPGVLAAVANGDPSSLESFQQPQRKAWRGRGLAIIRSTGERGVIRVTATSDGLAPATAQRETH